MRVPYMDHSRYAPSQWRSIASYPGWLGGKIFTRSFSGKLSRCLIQRKQKWKRKRSALEFVASSVVSFLNFLWLDVAEIRDESIFRDVWTAPIVPKRGCKAHKKRTPVRKPSMLYS